MTPLRQRMLEELQRRNYNTDTIRGYILAVEQFARYFRKSPELMGAEEIGQFQLHLLREKKLPVILSPEEITRLIEAAPNLLYRTLLILLYATGLRRSEVAHLKVSNIDRSLMLIHVQQGKGSRDRKLPLTEKVHEALREYWRAAKIKPRVYLFPTRKEPTEQEKPVSDKVVWNACHEAAQESGSVHAALSEVLGRKPLRPFLGAIPPADQSYPYRNPLGRRRLLLFPRSCRVSPCEEVKGVQSVL